MVKVYYWLYNSLPGTTGVRIALFAAIVAAVLAILFFVVFPKVSLVLVSNGLVYR